MDATVYLPDISRRQFVATSALALAGLAVGSCSSEANGTNGTAAVDHTLRVRQTQDPESLDPARMQDSTELNLLAYAALIRQAPDGELTPGLAESWQYVDDENKVFEITLRPDLKFSDGASLDAAAVKTNIENYADPDVASPAQQQLASLDNVEVIDNLTIRVNLSESHPLMPLILSEYFRPGLMISPEAIAEPDKLVSETFGAGPYVLVSDETVHGDHFTYVPNENYWNQDEVLWDKIVVHVMPEENSALAALETGQLNAAILSYSMAQPGIDAGLNVIGPGQPIVVGLSLWDREGEVVPALADVRVRQALNYAVNREQISEGLIGDFGIPTDQLSSPQHNGWNEDGYYPHDPARAKELLAEAGYADGFTLTVRTHDSEFLVRVVQAIADNLSQVGVELDITTVNQYDQADGEANRKFGAGLIGWGIEPAYIMARNFWLPDAPNNPFGSHDQTLVDLDAQAATADEESLADIEQQIIARLSEQAWFLPVVLFGNIVLHDDSVEMPWEEGQILPTLAGYRPAD